MGETHPARIESRPTWRVFAYTGVFCLAIGLMNWLLSNTPLWASMTVSFCIGWSINFAFLLLSDLFDLWLNPYVTPIPVTAIGLSAGLVLAGILVPRDPLFFFTENYSTLAVGVFFGIVGFLIFGTRGRLLQAEAELAQSQAETERQERLRVQTELKLLQAQIEPHFLFNTLSNIAGLIHKSPDAAEETLINLTRFLRASLARTRADSTTLAEELDIARSYLEIQSVRMQGRLSYAFKHDSQIDDLPLPPMLVQPLIENAIKHGIEPKETGGHVEVVTEWHDDTLTISVVDDGLGIPVNANGAGTGTSNVRERLKALYDDASLRIYENPTGGVTATIRIKLGPI